MNEGREAYGVDILNRLAKKIADDKAIYFLYTPDGKNQGGGPSGWSAAAVMSALIEGLAGIRDEASLFEKVTIAPRFAAAHIDAAHTCVRYGPSEAYVALDYLHRPAERMISMRLAGVAKTVHIRLFLPEGVTSALSAFSSWRPDPIGNDRTIAVLRFRSSGIVLA